MIFCARATRGRGLPSLDARSGRPISPHPWREIGWDQQVEERATRWPSCSRNAHDQNLPVWRAQWKFNQP